MFVSRRPFLISVTALVAAPFAVSAQAQISTAVAINRAARYRALSQRCAKLYCQQVLGVDAKQAADTLASAQRLIQTSTEDLLKAQLQGELSAQLRTVQQDIATYNTLLADAPAKDKLGSVNTQADKLLLNADRLSTMIEQTVKQDNAGLINLAGRQRMLSQRLAKNYLLGAAGMGSATLTAQMQSDRDNFSRAMQSLSTSVVNTPSIRNEIELLNAQWLLFSTQLNKGADATGLQTIASTSERILESANNLTQAYEGVLRDVLGRI